MPGQQNVTNDVMPNCEIRDVMHWRFSTHSGTSHVHVCVGFAFAAPMQLLYHMCALGIVLRMCVIMRARVGARKG